MMKSLLRADYFPPNLKEAIYNLADRALDVTPEEVQMIWLAAWDRDSCCFKEIQPPICDPSSTSDAVRLLKFLY
jgi:hypothetical protein